MVTVRDVVSRSGVGVREIDIEGPLRQPFTARGLKGKGMALFPKRFGLSGDGTGEVPFAF